jgi:hypothetical protein
VDKVSFAFAEDVTQAAQEDREAQQRELEKEANKENFDQMVEPWTNRLAPEIIEAFRKW